MSLLKVEPVDVGPGLLAVMDELVEAVAALHVGDELSDLGRFVAGQVVIVDVEVEGELGDLFVVEVFADEVMQDGALVDGAGVAGDDLPAAFMFIQPFFEHGRFDEQFLHPLPQGDETGAPLNGRRDCAVRGVPPVVALFAAPGCRSVP